MGQEMRVALCLSGTARWFTNTAQSLREHILDKWRPDVFIHTYYPIFEGYFVVKGKADRAWPYSRTWDTREGFEKDLRDTYNPVDIVIQDFEKEVAPTLDTKQYERDKANYGRSKVAGDIVPTLSQWYKIREVSSMKQTHENSGEFRYDVVIRGRFDLWFMRFDVNLEQVQQGIVYEAFKDGWGNGANMGDGTIYGGYMDNFSWGNSDVMDYWMDSYSHFKEMYEVHVPFNSEGFLRNHIDRRGYPVRPTDQAEFRFFGRGIAGIPE